MNIIQKFLSLGKSARSGIKFSKPLDKIIIHWIGPYPNQTVNSPWNWWEYGDDGGGVQASAHFILKDDNIIQSLPLNETGWHSGDARNYNSIGIEVVPMNEQGKFSESTIKTLKELIHKIRKDVDINLPLERHYDGVQKKDCPKFYSPLSNVITKDNFNNELNGQQRWENLVDFLNG